MSKIIFPEEKPMFKWSLKRRVSENLYWIHEVSRKVTRLSSDVNDLRDENQRQYKDLLEEIATLNFIMFVQFAVVVGLSVLAVILLLTR